MLVTRKRKYPSIIGRGHYFNPRTHRNEYFRWPKTVWDYGAAGIGASFGYKAGSWLVGEPHIKKRKMDVDMPPNLPVGPAPNYRWSRNWNMARRNLGRYGRVRRKYRGRRYKKRRFKRRKLVSRAVRKYKRTRYKIRKRKRRNYIKRIIQNTPNMGRMLRKCVISNDTIGNNENQVSYQWKVIATKTELNNKMDDEYIIRGQTDAKVEREETYDLTYNAGSKRAYKLLFSATLVWKLKNNYNYAVQCTVYYIKPKSSGNTDPKTSVELGLDEITSAANPETSVCWYPRMSQAFNQRWKVIKIKSFVLMSGQSYTCTSKTGWKVYDPMYPGSETTEYLSRHTRSIMIRMQGTISNNELDACGYSSGKLDSIIEKKWKFRHIGQHQVKRYTASETLQTGVSNYMNIQQDHAANNNPVDNQ